MRRILSRLLAGAVTGCWFVLFAITMVFRRHVRAKASQSSYWHVAQVSDRPFDCY
jgi:hypothetical protein